MLVTRLACCPRKRHPQVGVVLPGAAAKGTVCGVWPLVRVACCPAWPQHAALIWGQAKQGRLLRLAVEEPWPVPAVRDWGGTGFEQLRPWRPWVCARAARAVTASWVASCLTAVAARMPEPRLVLLRAGGTVPGLPLCSWYLT